MRFVSVASIWELAIKARKGKLADIRAEGLVNFVAKQKREVGFEVLPITEAHALATLALPDLHGDPFDRMFVAQAHIEGLTLVTGDTKLHAYPVKIRW